MTTNETSAERARSIMVIDDDRLLLEHVELILKDAGYWVTIVEDGEAALQLVPGVRPDLIILDSIMPGMTGPEVLARLKGDKATAWIPVMMLTAKTQSDSVKEAIKSGAEDYIAKPVEPGKLIDRVHKLLEKSDKKREAEGGMRWKGSSSDFDLPLQRSSPRTLGPTPRPKR